MTHNDRQEFFNLQQEIADAEIAEARRILTEEGRAVTLMVRGRRFRLSHVDDLRMLRAPKRPKRGVRVI